MFWRLKHGLLLRRQEQRDRTWQHILTFRRQQPDIDLIQSLNRNEIALLILYLSFSATAEMGTKRLWKK